MKSLGMHNLTAKYTKGAYEVVLADYAQGGDAMIILSPTGERQAVASVWLDETPRDGCVWLKGWSENEGLPEALQKAGVVKFTGRVCSIGYVDAHEAEIIHGAAA